VQERLRLPLTEQEPSEIRRRLADFYDQARLRLSQHDHYQRRILSHIVVGIVSVGLNALELVRET